MAFFDVLRGPHRWVDPCTRVKDTDGSHPGLRSHPVSGPLQMVRWAFHATDRDLAAGCVESHDRRIGFQRDVIVHLAGGFARTGTGRGASFLIEPHGVWMVF